jgi:hypothetical protein
MVVAVAVAQTKAAVLGLQTADLVEAVRVAILTLAALVELPERLIRAVVVEVAMHKTQTLVVLA